MGTTRSYPFRTYVHYGSSPRVWGLHLPLPHGRRSARFIPTRVGTTPAARSSRAGSTVHPHACGDYDTGIFSWYFENGSSPRVWGLRQYKRGEHALAERFIPTRVGTTELRRDGEPFWRFIPTRVGTTRVVHPSCSTYRGSSPRVWGLRGDGGGGSSISSVHPHACGDYSRSSNLAAPDHGSSPRVWGLRTRSTPRCSPLRFIPTRVGTTLAPVWTMGSLDGSSPRVWGLLNSPRKNMRNFHGSSPRVWGLRAGANESGPGCRFIPTRVGTTPCHHIEAVDE